MNLSVPRPDVKKVSKLAVYIVALVVILVAMSRVVVIIPANTVGIVFAPLSGGIQDTTLEEGFHIINPVNKIYEINTEVQTKQIHNLYGQTKDSQFLTISVDIKYKIDKSTAFEVFRNFKTLNNVDTNLIVPTVQRAIESSTTNYNIMEILGSKRNEVYLKIEVDLQERLQTNGISLHSISFLDTDAGAEIENAIKSEAVAKKAVETAEQERLRAQIDAERRIIEAQAEAEEKRILAESISKNPEILELEWIKKWNGILPEVMTGDGNGLLFDLSKDR